MPYAVGIDVGTTNCKLVLCSLSECETISIDRFESPKVYEGTFTDYDVEALVSGIIDALRACVQRLAQAASEIRFVSIASVGESGVLVNCDGSYSKRSICWFDTRGEEYVRQVYETGLDRWLYGITGIPAHSNSALFKILWLRDHGADLNRATWLPMADFIAWVLCGSFGQDATLASRTSVLDLRTGSVSKEVLRHFGLPEGLFPEVVPSGVARGTIKEEVAHRTGLPRSCQVHVTGHDHMSGSVACGFDPHAELLNSTGTSEGILMVGGMPDLDDESYARQVTNGLYVNSDSYSRYSSLPTAGFSFEWALDALGVSADRFFAADQLELHQRYLVREFDGSGVLFVPHLRGSGPPRRNPNARGAFAGIGGDSSRKELLFAVHLGVALELRNLYQGMGIAGMDRMKVIGPATKNPLWMQLKADVLGIPVVACDVQEAVARGAAMIAAERCGYVPKLERIEQEYVPDVGRAAWLDEIYSKRYVPLSDAIAQWESAWTA